MMVLDLQCSNNHFFEAWFANSETFNRQKEAGELRCPICNDHKIQQALSPVTIKRSSHFSPKVEGSDTTPSVNLLERFYQYIEKNFEEVGTNFAKEALKMHYGVVDRRNIRGTSTMDEEKMLEEEGVEFHKIPFPKREQ